MNKIEQKIKEKYKGRQRKEITKQFQTWVHSKTQQPLSQEILDIFNEIEAEESSERRKENGLGEG